VAPRGWSPGGESLREVGALLEARRLDVTVVRVRYCGDVGNVTPW
jgi:hypothetical protein